MNRRQYLIGVGSGVSALPIGSHRGNATDHISVEITEANTLLEGGDLLDMAGELENNGSSDERVELDFIVGEDGEVVSQRTIPVEAGETREVNFLQFRTYPVRSDDSFPVRLETETDVAEITVDVLGVDEFDSQYAYPDRDQELIIQPETRIHFEIDNELPENQGGTHWYINGEYITTPMGPWSSTYLHDVGREYFAYTFESEGSYTVDATVTTGVENVASRWEVTVTDDGPEPPTVDDSRPDASELGTDESTTLELDVSTSETDLNRVVWWMTQSDVILNVSDINGSSDTASIDIDGGCHTCRIEAWVMDENNVCTVVDSWQFVAYEEEEEVDLADGIETVGDFEDRLELEGIEVEYAELVSESLYLDYYTQASTEQEKLEEIWIIASAYAALVDSGNESTLLHTIFMNQYGLDLGDFMISSEWAEDYADGEMSEEVYLDQILETLGYE